jgi:5-methylcytosine-specific restriction protein B
MVSTTPSTDAINVLRLLKQHHNVVIGGPPATGKSLLLGEVSQTFESYGRPPLVSASKVPIPAGATGPMPDWMPSPNKAKREAFVTAFHQGTKFRDWLRGLIPVPGGAGVAFKVSRGVFWRAIEFAGQPDAAALVVVDEVNRGPAVQIFGDTLVALETDKRLDPDGKPRSTTARILVMTDAGDFDEVAIPYHLYIVAAMNRADTSVEPLDVAFLRRWQPYTLVPDATFAASWLSVPDANAEPPEAPATGQDALLALLRAWVVINHRITLLRGQEYQLGHGVLMAASGPPATGIENALAYAAGIWQRLWEHITELFFGDTRTIAAVVSADSPASPFTVNTGLFADTPTHELVGPIQPSGADLYKILRAIAVAT